MIHIDPRSNKAIYEQIIEQIKTNVLKGFLKEGDALPSVRKLAIELAVTPGTVSKAYQELERQHVIETIRGKGTFIAKGDNAFFNEEKLEYAKKALKTQCVDLIYMGIEKADIVQLVNDICESICESREENKRDVTV